jgi:predicted aspartyl protease
MVFMSIREPDLYRRRGQRSHGYMLLSLTLLLALIPGISSAEQPGDLGLFGFTVNLDQSASGSLTLTGKFDGIEDTFLLDTGANMITVSRDLFQKLRKLDGTVKVRQVGARLANGKLNLIDVYRVEHFSIGNNCELGPVEVAVMQQGGRNLLGMNALAVAAPFAVFTSPPSLAVSHCTFPSLDGAVAQTVISE